MKFKIPFTYFSAEVLRRKAKAFEKFIKHKKNSSLGKNLHSIGIDLEREEYIAISLRSFLIYLVLIYLIATTTLALINVKSFFIWGFGVSFLFSGFIYFSQMAYPKVFLMKKEREIERNLLSALEDILVQLNSGIPLFTVMINISDADYGELSEEFKKAVRRINAGSPEQEVLEQLSRENTSEYFRRTLWQISNGMNAGSDMAVVIRDSINALNEEQIIQIQSYGNKLNPLVVFYMLVAVIIPSLSITFLTIFSSMVGLNKFTTMILFLSLFVIVMFMQIMFLGLIKSKRPSLL